MRDVGRTRGEFGNHEQQVSGLQSIISSIIIQKTRDFSVSLPAQQPTAD